MCYGLPPFGASKVGADTVSGNFVEELGVIDHMIMQNHICAPDADCRSCNHNVQLKFETRTAEDTHSPDACNCQTECNFNKPGNEMADADIYEHVVQVSLVRFKRAFALEHTHCHHAQCVKHRDRQDCE